MHGVHDLGGVEGFGPVVQEPDEPVFHDDWERVVFTMVQTLAIHGLFVSDKFRYGVEQMPAVRYLTSTYYEHWLFSLTKHAIDAGIVDADELADRTRYYREHPDEVVPPSSRPELVDRLRLMIEGDEGSRREVTGEARFAVGDVVRVLDHASVTHTRRARYVRGRVGTVLLTHGAHVFPDTSALEMGEDPEFVYAVEFLGDVLWQSDDRSANSRVIIDLWESYLEPVDHATTERSRSVG